LIKPTRRDVVLGGAGAAGLAGAPALRVSKLQRPREQVVVVGAGVFGAWTATHLQRLGKRVLLLDDWSPAHARASSGGESRMTRAAYGADEIYARMAMQSLVEWKALSARADMLLFHQTGVLFFFPKVEAYLTDSIAVHRKLGLPSRLLDRGEMMARFPMIDFTRIEAGIYEPGFGALMARRGVASLVAEFVVRGGTYRRAAIRTPEIRGGRLDAVVTQAGEPIAANAFVFACGPWLPKLFPAVLGRRIFPTRQEVFFFATPPGDSNYEVGKLPGWADFNGGDVYYGFPDLEGRGFKIAHDTHGPPIDPDTSERSFSPEKLADIRAFMASRFPALSTQPLNESRVCQYENSANGDFLVDRHPAAGNVLLVGGGSGHGFKHGPAVGAYAARLLTGALSRPEPRFSLASKGEVQARAVH